MKIITAFIILLLVLMSCGDDTPEELTFEEKLMTIIGSYTGVEDVFTPQGNSSSTTTYRVADYAGSIDSILIDGDFSKRVYIDSTCVWFEGSGSNNFYEYSFNSDLDTLTVRYLTGGNAIFTSVNFIGRKN